MSGAAMVTAQAALEVAVMASLAADPALAGALGGARIYADMPRGAAYPFLTLGETDSRDWSTQTSTGHEHFIAIHAWSRARDRREAQGAIALAQAALEKTPPTPEGHRLVSWRTVFWTTVRSLDGGTYHGMLRLRAVTEKLN